jgi:thiol-disulfide isomerase/thioredoxin
MSKTNAFLLVAITVLLHACSISAKKLIEKNKPNYTVSRDEGHEGHAKIVNGIINREILESDTAFAWFKTNYKYAQPNQEAVQVLKEKKDKFSVLVFVGTWCHDSQNLLPLFYKLADAGGLSNDKIIVVGVSREKTTLKNLHTIYNIKNVPTFIIMSNGKEVGRVVEYGSTGYIDKELAAIIKTLP